MKESELVDPCGKQCQAHMFAYEGQKDCALWFKWARPPAGAVAHESFHAVRWLLQYSGTTNLNDDTEECFAYLLQWLVNEIGQRVW